MNLLHNVDEQKNKNAHKSQIKRTNAMHSFARGNEFMAFEIE